MMMMMKMMKVVFYTTTSHDDVDDDVDDDAETDKILNGDGQEENEGVFEEQRYTTEKEIWYLTAPGFLSP